MTNSPIDQNAQHALQDEMDEIGNTFDPIDLYSALMMLADLLEVDFEEFISSHTAKDIIRFSQSNLEGLHDRLMRMHTIDNTLADL